MNKCIVVIFLLCFNALSFAQIYSGKKLRDLQNRRVKPSDSVKQNSKSGKSKTQQKAKITDYLIVSHLSDTTHVDTTLSIKKEYKYNYLRKDNFNLMPFSNMGQSYNTLSKDFENTRIMPSFGARARHFNYMEVDDVKYYHVPTPLTELMYKTAFEQGQLIDALFTVNTSRQFNFSAAYKGLRSLGKYQNIITSTGNFRFTTSYKTKNRRYIANAHFVAQDLSNEENGGLKDDNLAFFESGDKDFDDRGVLEVNFDDGTFNILKGKRFYLNHKFNITNNTNATGHNNLNLTHVFNIEDKKTHFEQPNDYAYFGTTTATKIDDRVKLREISNQLQLNYSNKTLGELQFNATHNTYNYGDGDTFLIDSVVTFEKIKGEALALGGKYKKQLKGFKLQGELGANISGDFNGNFLKAQATYAINKDINLKAQLNHSATQANYNAQINQSDYDNYNWKNDFKTIKTQQLAFGVASDKYINLSVDLSTINDYVYFAKDATTALVKPLQSDKAITYLRVKANKDIKYKKFALDNTIMYQSVKDDNQVFNVPQIITRNTLYYSTNVFKKAMYLQTGITFNYFTEYNMDGYDPLLAEFYTQNETKLGGFPRLDFFVNAKVRQTRIYLKAEHFNSPFTKPNYYSAPNQPYRDFTVRFGLVWNFFL